MVTVDNPAPKGSPRMATRRRRKAKKARKTNPRKRRRSAALFFAAPRRRRHRRTRRNPAHAHTKRHTRRRRRRNPGGIVMDVLTATLAGTATSIAGDVVVGFAAKYLPSFVQGKTTSAAMKAALSAVAAYMLRKNPALAIGIAAGGLGELATMLARGALKTAVPSLGIGDLYDQSAGYQAYGNETPNFMPYGNAIPQLSAIEYPQLSAVDNDTAMDLSGVSNAFGY